MTKNEFKTFVKKMAVYFNREKFILDDKNCKDRLRVWFERVQKIPANSLPWIEKNIQNDFDYMPPNFPKTVRYYFVLYRESRPEKQNPVIYGEAVECQFCDSGMLFMKKEITFNGVQVLRDYVARCGHCEADTRSGIEMLTIEEAKNKGYII